MSKRYMFQIKDIRIPSNLEVVEEGISNHQYCKILNDYSLIFLQRYIVIRYIYYVATLQMDCTCTFKLKSTIPYNIILIYNVSISC